MARNSDSDSSRISYDSESGSTSFGFEPAGRAGRVYAGPLVRVRSGRSGKLPAKVSLSVQKTLRISSCLSVVRLGLPRISSGKPAGC